MENQVSSIMSCTESELNSESPWWTSWSEAHLKACRDRLSLVATPQQVLDYTNTRVSEDTQENIFWSLPSSSQVIEWTYQPNSSSNKQFLQEVCSRFGNQQENNLATPTKDEVQDGERNPYKTPSKNQITSGGLLQSVTKTVSATLTPLLGVLTPGRTVKQQGGLPPEYYLSNEQDDALQSWNSSLDQEADAATNTYANTPPSSYDQKDTRPVDWNQPILNPILTRDYLRFISEALESAMSSSAADSASFPRVVTRRKLINNHRKEGVLSWNDWLRQISGEMGSHSMSLSKDLLSRLSSAESDFLLECMAQMGHVTLIPPDPKSGTPKEELVVLGGVPGMLLDSATEDPQLYHQVLASWWEVTSALESLEQKRQQWSRQAEEWSQRALQERRQRGRTGLASFKLHKQFLQRLEESEGILENLEQAKHTLEQSWHQRQVLQALESSTQTMQAIRLDMERVDDVMESYREEVDHVNTVQERLSATTMGNVGDFDEDELLKELEGLTLESTNSESQVQTQVPPVAAVDAEAKEGTKELPAVAEDRAQGHDSKNTAATATVPAKVSGAATDKVLLPA